MAKNSGWVPQQHGAWAMLAVPTALGLWHADASSARDWAGRVALALTFWVGYFLFNVVSLWLKAPARRRPALHAPLFAYASGTAVAGLAALVLLGWPVVWWALFFGPLMLGTWALVAARRERSLLSGLLTVVAASGFATTVVQPDAWVVVEDPGAHRVALWVSALCFAYFFGTVWSVKTMIRQRGSLAWFAGAIAHHLAAVVLAAWGVWAGQLGWAFVLFFCAALVRTIVWPLLGPLSPHPRTITPKMLGMVEVVFSTALLLLCTTFL